MSELNSRGVDDVYIEYYNTGKHELAQVYLKSDVDAVLAEKDAEIAQLQAMLEERNKQVGELKHSLELASNECCSISERAVKKLRHHKYKRGLAMAKWCEIGAQFQHNIVMQFDNPFYIKRAEWLEKWHKRWLEIAEKFKEAK